MRKLVMRILIQNKFLSNVTAEPITLLFIQVIRVMLILFRNKFNLFNQFVIVITIFMTKIFEKLYFTFTDNNTFIFIEMIKYR